MNHFLIFLASYLVNSVWEVMLVAGTGWLASRAVKRLGPQAEHHVWVATLALALITPALPFLGWIPAGIDASPGTVQKVAMTLSAAEGNGAAMKGVWILPAFAVWMLLAVYGAVVLAFAARLGRLLVSTAQLKGMARRPRLNDAQQEMLRRCERCFGLNEVDLLSSAAVAGPVTLGFLRPVLLVPDGFVESCVPNDLLAALAHECAHIRRNDFAKNLAYEIASLVLSFHPVVWMIKARIAQTREMICDEMVTDRLVEARPYAQSLLRLATMMAVRSQARLAHAIGIFDANILETRIMRMNLKKEQVGRAVRFGLVNGAAFCLLGASMGAAALALVVEPATGADTAQPDKPLGQVYKVGNGVSVPVLLATPLAKFPASERGSKGVLNAVVLVGLVVDAEGKPREVHVVKSFRPDFDANAVAAVEKYQFKPALHEGKAVPVWVNVEVNFKRY
jgi:TonB family protein